MRELAQIDPWAPVGTIAEAVVGGVEMAVVHHAQGWVMVVNACPHAQCRLTEDGQVDDGFTLICNCHGSEFDLRDGELLLGPAREPLQLIRLAVRSGVLAIAAD